MSENCVTSSNFASLVLGLFRSLITVAVVVSNGAY